MKCYSELITLPTFQKRFEYLKTLNVVGGVTFGSYRYLNQTLYRKSAEWRELRRHIITRDEGNDMALEGYPVLDGRVHHIIPITIEMILDRDPLVFSPENLVLVSEKTHRAIHFSKEYNIADRPIERRPNDQCPWRS